VSADPCFGACDVVNYELKNLDVDCVIHIGHTAIADVENFWIPTIFLNAQSTLDVSKVVEKALPSLVGKKIGLVTTAQHLHTLETVQTILQHHGLKHSSQREMNESVPKDKSLAVISPVGRTSATRSIVSYSSASGTFHPVGLSMSTKKTVIAADPYTNTVKKQEIEDMKTICYDNDMEQSSPVVMHDASGYYLD